jgi:hypothetical protein
LCFDAGTRTSYKYNNIQTDDRRDKPPMTNPNAPETPAAAAAPQRREWVTPELSCIPANSAEVGANPISPEGAFGTGS